MSEGNGCCCNVDTAVTLACSGGSNVGQITNEVAKSLWSEGLANFYCLAGVGGHVSGMVASVEGSQKVLVLDGCPAGCARKCVEAAGLTDYEYVVVTDLGIAKKKTFDLAQDDLERVQHSARARLGAQEAGVPEG
ncbi:MAG: putative zinc-binding protein [Candidatus Brocadiia bacterium]